MNFNAEFYKFSFTEKNFSKFALLLTFFQSLDQRNFIKFLKYLRTSPGFQLKLTF
jgi:hypothetical protein